MRRRGLIRKRGKGWQIKFDVPAIDGTRQTRYVQFTGSYQDAQKELTRLLNAADTGNLPSPSSSTLAEYLENWFAGAHRQSPKTLERYRELAAYQIIPYLGELGLQKISPEQVRAWHSRLLEKGLSARTIRHAHRLLFQVLQCAIKDGKLTRNVASVHRPPAVEDREIAILSPEQIAAVRAALQGSTLFHIVELALATGMRRGELLGLQWGDVDLDTGSIVVQRSLEETRAEGLRLKSPKTKRGRRKVTLTPDAIAMLRAHKLEQLELRARLGMGKLEATSPVFGDLNGQLIKPQTVSKAWQRALAAHKLPVVMFPSLRHTHASMLIKAGIDVLTISRRLGHSKAAITLDVYGHLIAGSDEAAAAAIAKALK